MNTKPDRIAFTTLNLDDSSYLPKAHDVIRLKVLISSSAASSAATLDHC